VAKGWLREYAEAWGTDTYTLAFPEPNNPFGVDIKGKMGWAKNNDPSFTQEPNSGQSNTIDEYLNGPDSRHWVKFEGVTGKNLSE
jgi:hypothetical protein